MLSFFSDLFFIWDISLMPVTALYVQKDAMIRWLGCWLSSKITQVLFPQVSKLLHQRNGSNKSKKWWLKMQKKIRIEINLLIFDTKLFFNTYLNAFAARRGGCVMLVARLCQGRASCFFKSCFNLFWKSGFCHRKSNHTVLCTSGLESPSVSFNMEMLLALTLPSGGVVHGGKRSRRSSLLLPAIPASWTMILSPFLCLNLVFWWFADTSLASHINSNSMTRCLLHFSQHPLQP